MLRSMFSGVSGLRGHQTRMDVIGNNISNVNTTGFKYSRVTFAETYAQTMRAGTSPSANRGGSNPQQVGLGQEVSSIDTIFTQGQLETTGRPLDIAIQGEGFFVLSEKETRSRHYARDGNFSIDADGFLVNANGGALVQGWTANDRGEIDTTKPINGIQLPIARKIPPRATEQIQTAGNLSHPPTLKRADASTQLFGTAAGAALMPGATFNPGDVLINSVSITGTIPATPSNEEALRAFADLVNAKTEQHNVFATVKGSGATARLILTSRLKGDDSVITLGGVAGPLTDVGLNALATAPEGPTYTVDTKTTASNTVAAGSISINSGELIINNVDVGNLGPTAATNSAEQNAQEIAGLINKKTHLTGVTATTDGAGNITLTAGARDIIITGSLPTTAGFAVAGGNIASTDSVARHATVIAGNSINIYDTQGTEHLILLNYNADYTINLDADGVTPTGTTFDGTWHWAAGSSDPAIAVLSHTDVNGTYTDRTIKFANDGILQSFTDGRFSIQYANSNATPPDQVVKVNHGPSETTEGLTQFGGPITAEAVAQDGYAAADLMSFGVDINGVMQGVYSNGQQKALAQLALAYFPNPGALYKAGDQSQIRGASNTYVESPNSGNPRIGVALTGGRGEIRGGTLELSNVDLAQQFTDLIITQRGFQANSRIITTSDEMLQELVNLKR